MKLCNAPVDDEKGDERKALTSTRLEAHKKV
jgi:hypothetical protein